MIYFFFFQLSDASNFGLIQNTRISSIYMYSLEYEFMNVDQTRIAKNDTFYWLKLSGYMWIDASFSVPYIITFKSITGWRSSRSWSDFKMLYVSQFYILIYFCIKWLLVIYENHIVFNDVILTFSYYLCIELDTVQVSYSFINQIWNVHFKHYRNIYSKEPVISHI